ncbi:MAG: hypothetical protein ACLQPN_05360 [Bryobacteraceae bacterium]
MIRGIGLIQRLVDAQGKTAFTPREGGQHHVLSVNDAQRARILEAFLWLCTQPAR